MHMRSGKVALKVRRASSRLLPSRHAALLAYGAVIAAVIAAALAGLPAYQCVEVQSRIFAATTYQLVTERADGAAREYCQRHGNAPQRLPRPFEVAGKT